jgi:hypothetical protein
MLTTPEKNAIKKILRPTPDKKAALQAILDAYNDLDGELDLRNSLQDFQRVKTSVNNPKRIGVTRAANVEFDPQAACHQSGNIKADLRSDIAITLDWDLQEAIEAF